jgi:hypothetical protein
MHNHRACGLRGIFNEAALAEFLHLNYRATFKAMHVRAAGRNIPGQLGLKRNCINEHDHGFGSCHKKKYFLRRARFLLKEF